MENELHHQTATFEKIWATLDRIAESQKEAALEMEEQRKKDKLEAKREKKKYDKEMKELRGLFTSQWGALMESLVEGDLVLFPFNFDLFRAQQRCQDKAQSAENGAPLSRTATPYWHRCCPPCGRAGKRSPAALRLLARARHSLRGVPCAQPLPDPLNRSKLNGKSTREQVAVDP